MINLRLYQELFSILENLITQWPGCFWYLHTQHNIPKSVFPGSSDGKESASNAGDLGSIPGFMKIPWRGEWLPTPVFLPGELHEQRNPVGYSPRGRKELEATEQLSLFFP